MSFPPDLPTGALTAGGRGPGQAGVVPSRPDNENRRRKAAWAVGALLAALLAGCQVPTALPGVEVRYPIVPVLRSAPASPAASPSWSAASAPIVSAPPVIEGTAAVGYLLTASTPGCPPGVEFGYEWLREGVPIADATTGEYWLTKADEGKAVAVRVTATLPDADVDAEAEATVETSEPVKVGSGKTGEKLTDPFVVKGIWVINKEHRVTKDYIKKGPGTLGSKQEASDALAELTKAANQAGYPLKPTWGWRSWDTQTTLWQRNVNNIGKELGEQYAAPPGASEHNAGLAFDLSSNGLTGYPFGSSKAGKWVAANAWKYGFIMRYPDGKTPITGYAYEPWHFRYIGVEHSEAFKDNPKLTLEEYLGLA